MSPAEKSAEEVTRAEAPLWERQAGETTKQFQAFCIYRDMEDRTLRKTAEALKKSMTPVAHWGMVNNWRFRARAWDDHLEELKLAAVEQEVKDMAKRHAGLAVVMMNTVMEKMKNFPAASLTASDIAKWVETSVKVERLSRGQPTENVSAKHEGEVLVSSPLIDRIANSEAFKELLLANSVEPADPTPSSG